LVQTIPNEITFNDIIALDREREREYLGGRNLSKMNGAFQRCHVQAPQIGPGSRAAFVWLRGGIHQQPGVNYIQVLEKFDFPCTVNAQHLPFKGNQLRAETG
jgi:hypothetical protein